MLFTVSPHPPYLCVHVTPPPLLCMAVFAPRRPPANLTRAAAPPSYFLHPPLAAALSGRGEGDIGWRGVRPGAIVWFSVPQGGRGCPIVIVPPLYDSSVFPSIENLMDLHPPQSIPCFVPQPPPVLVPQISEAGPAILTRNTAGTSISTSEGGSGGVVCAFKKYQH